MILTLATHDIPGRYYAGVIVAVLLLLALVVLQGRTSARQWRRLSERLSFLETWGQRTDPRYFAEHGQLDAIYLDLESEPPLVDCLEAGRLHEANRDGRTCKHCPADLTPTRP